MAHMLTILLPPFFCGAVLSVAEGRRIELLSPKSGAAAEEVILPFETLESEYNNFSTWAAQNAYFLSE